MNYTNSTKELGHHEASASSTSLQSSTIGPKRNRIRMSCVSCRHGKLKCDRQHPCSQCVRRGKASDCVFPVPSHKPIISLKNRLKHLEGLVKDAMSSQNLDSNGALPTAAETSIEVGVSLGGTLHHSPSHRHESETDMQQTGQVLVDQGQAYVGATHWAAILEDVNTHPFSSPGLIC